MSEMAWIIFRCATVFAMMAIILGALAPAPPKDNTDPAEGRSQMGLHTDCLTGLQYLTARGGGITPRLGNDGNQIVDRTGCDT